MEKCIYQTISKQYILELQLQYSEIVMFLLSYNSVTLW